MFKHFIIILFTLCITSSVFSQRKLSGFGKKISKDDKEINRQFGVNDSISSDESIIKLSGKTKYTDYKIISFKGDSTIIDTTLTLQKDYKFNFLGKDNFELLAFHNQGQTFNNLGYDFSNISIFPEFGFRAKHFNFYELEDINYYQLPTPTTQILYRTGLQQGQVLDALFTLNFSKRLNVSIAYKGLRSLGNYRRSLASHGNFRGSFHYKSPKNQYNLKGHVAFQDITNQESGGITESSLAAFINDDETSSNDRDRLDINLNDAENLLDNKRYFLEQTYRLFSTEVPDSIKKRDSIQQKNFTNLKIGHSFLLDNKFYKFNQTTITSAVFGDANSSGNIEDTVDSQFLSNQLFLDFNSKYILGNFRGKLIFSNYEYGYNSFTNINAYPTVSLDKLKGNAISFGADWNAKIKNIKLIASTTITPGSGRLSGTDFRGELSYKKDSLYTITGHLNINSKSPNFNMLFHQSVYDNYNWQNNFNSVNSRIIGGTFESKWGNASLDLTNISNYVYFNENSTPTQASENLNYLKLKINKEFKVGKFALYNTIMYQNVSSGSNYFRVPELVTRNTLYYADNWFKGNPLFVNIGVTFKYFTKYKANAYNPLLSEFTIQNTTDIGYPTFDVFFNARVRRTRIYFKIDNVTSSFSSKNYFSAPNYPYRDFTIRFGLVWNWFI